MFSLRVSGTGRKTYVTFVRKIDKHELVVLFAFAARYVETYCGHASSQTTLDEVVSETKFIHLHRGVLQVLHYI